MGINFKRMNKTAYGKPLNVPTSIIPLPSDIRFSNRCRLSRHLEKRPPVNHDCRGKETQHAANLRSLQRNKFQISGVVHMYPSR